MGALTLLDGLADAELVSTTQHQVTQKKDLTFVIPVRHSANLRDAGAQQQVLRKTFQSISGQKSRNWRAVVVANHGTTLPKLPEGFEVVWVDYAPNPQHDIKSNDFQTAMDFFRLDKGRRVWSGMRAFPDTHYFMIVDDDDFVSRDLTGFVNTHRGENGWFIQHGYGIGPKGGLAIELDRFHKTCGTSHIARADLYDLPEENDSGFAHYVRKWLGSHGATTEHFEKIGAPLSVLPFQGAVYLVNNPNSHSQSNRLLRQYVFNKHSLKKPWTLPGKMSRLKRIDAQFQAEFLGAA